MAYRSLHDSKSSKLITKWAFRANTYQQTGYLSVDAYLNFSSILLIFIVVPGAGIEPARLAAGDFESVIYSVSTGKWGEF